MKKTSLNKGVLKKVLRLVGKYPCSLASTLLFAGLSVAFTLYVPYLLGDAIDCIVAKNNVNFSALKTIFIKIGVSVFITAVSTWLTSVFNQRITYGVVEEIRKRAFEKIARLPLKYIDTHAHGDTVSRIVTDADQFADGLLMGFTQFFTGVLTIVGTVGFMLMASWKIALVVVFVTPLSLLVAKFIATHTHDYFVKQSEIRAEQTAFAEEIIGGLKTVQAFSMEAENERRFNEIDERLQKASLDATFYSSMVNPSTRFVNNFVYAVVALIGALSIVGGGFTAGGLTKFLSYANQYTKPFNEISGVVTELSHAFVCASRIFDLLDEEELSKEPTTELKQANGNVDFDKVYFSYTPEKPLIENFSLKVKVGQKIAIVGPTGCGKTTLVNLLMRFYDPVQGQISVDGVKTQTVTRNSLRKNYGMVLQDTWIQHGTVKQNIAFGKPDATDEEIISAAKAAHAHGFIKRLKQGYETLLSEDGALSQGQKQLLCIARIMLLLPPILILDEATSSIDTRTEMKISDGFETLTKGKTSFVVAHRLSTIQSADIILVMNAGNVVEQGTHKELLEKKGFYYGLYQSQFA